MSKKKIGICVSFEMSRIEEMRKAAEEQGHGNVSLFLRRWVAQFPFGKQDVVPIVIDVPRAFLGRRALVEKHLKPIFEKLIDKLSDC